MMCGRSREDAGYAKYPRLPVVVCAGYEDRAVGKDVHSHDRES